MEHPTILLLGAAYNPGAMDTTHSLGVALYGHLKDLGWNPILHDPAAAYLELPAGSASREIAETKLSYLVEKAHAIVFCTDWPEYRDLDTKGKPTVDLRGRKG